MPSFHPGRSHLSQLVVVAAVLSLFLHSTGVEAQARSKQAAPGYNATEEARANKFKATIAYRFFRAANLTSIKNSTIFAPTDEAFNRLAASFNATNINALLQPPLLNTSLSILKLHVVPGIAIRTTDIACDTGANTTLPTLLDAYNITLSCTNNTLYVSGPGIFGSKPPVPVVDRDIRVKSEDGTSGRKLLQDFDPESNIVDTISDVLV